MIGNPLPNQQFLVYSSFGDRNRFAEFWLNRPDKRGFDLWGTYYGDRNEVPDRHLLDRCFRSKGGKFQNFHRVYVANRSAIERYDAVFLLDDDIQIGTEDINRMFELRREFGLWIAQPAFPPHSRISHAVTARIPGALLHFTNFVEMCVPLFSRRALARFMENFDPRLVGWGSDYLYMWANGIQRKDRYAVVDAIGCINPDPPPGVPRECEKLGPAEQVIANWRMVAGDKGIRQWQQVTHGTVYNAVPDLPRSGSARPELHDYLARTCRVEVVESGAGGHSCRCSGDRNGFHLNDSALTVFGLCNGVTTLCNILLRLKAGLGLQIDEVSALHNDVEQILREFASRGLVRAYPVAHDSASIVPGLEPAVGVAPLLPDNVPASIQIINLGYRTDRWLSLSAALEHAGVPMFSRLAAVDARQYESVDRMLAAFGSRLDPRYRAHPGFDPYSHRFKAKTACALSHRAALNNIVESGAGGWHIVLEDDNRPLHAWPRLLDSLADSLEGHPGRPDMILLSDRVGIARPATGIDDHFGAEAYAVHASACTKLRDSIDFSSGRFHLDYSPDTHYYHLCTAGRLDITVFANGPWIENNKVRGDSDIER